MNKIIFLILLFSLSFSCAAAEKRAWTYLFYVASDEKEVEPFVRLSLKWLENAGSDSHKWIVLQTDYHANEPSERRVVEQHPSEPDVTKPDTLQLQSPIVWKSKSEINSADPEELKSFLKWGMDNYPADHYALFLFGHSYGWRGILMDENPGFSLPPNPAGPKTTFLMMSPTEFRGVLEDFFHGENKLDLLVMDSCNDAGLEWFYELRDLVKVYVGAVLEMPYVSFDYGKSLKPNFQTPQEIARTLVADMIPPMGRGGKHTFIEGEHPAQSTLAVDLENWEPFWDLWKRWTEAVSKKEIRKSYLGDNHDYWVDEAENISLLELLRDYSERGHSAQGRSLAVRMLKYLGESYFQSVDSQFIEFHVPDNSELRFTFEGDELMPQRKAFEKARKEFDLLNPQYLVVSKRWFSRTTVVDGKKRFQFVVEFLAPTKVIQVRPFLSGCSWVYVEILKDKKLIDSKHFSSPTTFHLTEQFPNGSPFIAVGHTFGAGRSVGPALNLQYEEWEERPENFHWDGKNWTYGSEFYKSLSWGSEMGWSDLILK